MECQVERLNGEDADDTPLLGGCGPFWVGVDPFE